MVSGSRYLHGMNGTRRILQSVFGVLLVGGASAGARAGTEIAFGPPVAVPVVAGISALAVGDLDGDGWPDLATSLTSSNRLVLFRNLGATNPPGTFQFGTPVVLGCPTNPSVISIADLNNDHRPELIVGVRDAAVLFENHSVPGTLDESSFALAATLAPDPALSSGRTAEVVVGDFDGDGAMDLLAATRNGSVWRNLAQGGALSAASFAPPVVLTNDLARLGLCSADFDGSGLPDVALAGGARVFLNTSRPGALEFQRAGVGVRPEGLADIDSDGLPDQYSNGSLFDPPVLDVQLNQSTPGDLRWGASVPVVGLPGQVLQVEDLDRDGRGDLVLSVLTTNLSVIRNPYLPGTVGRVDLGPAVTVGPYRTMLGRGPLLVFADLDSDGRKECVIYRDSPRVLEVFPNMTVTEPEAWLQIPARTRRLPVGAVVSARAYAFHIPWTVSRVEFLEGTNRVAVAASPADAVEITLTRAGVLEFRAEVVSAGGERLVSEPVRVLVADELNTPLLPAVLGAQADAASSYVIATNGELYACGRNDRGQLGQGITNASQSFFSPIPRPGGVARWFRVVAGGEHALGLADTGELLAWGENRSGQLGLGYTNTYESAPVLVPGPVGVTGWREVRAGASHSLALAEDGRLFGWGANGQGQLGLVHTNDLARPTLIPAPGGAAGWTAVAAAADHSAGVATSGEIYVWGFSKMGELAEGQTNAVPRPTLIPRPAGVSRWVSVAAGGVFNLALADDGRLYSWGINAGGLLGLGERSTNLPAVMPVPEAVELPAGVTAWTGFSAGQDHSLALGNDGQLYAWGANNSSGELGTGDTWWLEPVRSPALVVRPANVTSFKAFTAGSQFSLGIGDDDRLYAWGANGQGQLGNGASAPDLSPQPLPTAVCSLDLFCPGITNLLPTIAILSPPTGTRFYSPASCEVVVEAADPDGVLDEVELFVVRQVSTGSPETNRVGRLTSPPYRFSLTNLASAVKSLFARATDNSGARVETPARYLTIYSGPSLSYVPLATNAMPNPFTGFFEQRVTFQNASSSPVAGLRLLVANLTNGVALADAFGETNGTPYVEHAFAVPPGERITFTLEYIVPPGQPWPNPRFSAVLVTPEPSPAPSGASTGLSLWLIAPGGGVGLEFPTEAGAGYAIQYSANLRDWWTSRPDVFGDGGFRRWLDQGPPRTLRPPGTDPQRFYRVLRRP